MAKQQRPGNDKSEFTRQIRKCQHQLDDRFRSDRGLINKRIYDKHPFTTKVTERPREIHLADGNLSEMCAITHIAELPMEIGGHKELATLQVANLQNHEMILGMPWLKGHNPKIDWEKKKITSDSERCIT